MKNYLTVLASRTPDVEIATDTWFDSLYSSILFDEEAFSLIEEIDRAKPEFVRKEFTGYFRSDIYGVFHTIDLSSGSKTALICLHCFRHPELRYIPSLMSAGPNAKACIIRLLQEKLNREKNAQFTFYCTSSDIPLDIREYTFQAPDKSLGTLRDVIMRQTEHP